MTTTIAYLQLLSSGHSLYICIALLQLCLQKLLPVHHLCMQLQHAVCLHLHSSHKAGCPKLQHVLGHSMQQRMSYPAHMWMMLAVHVMLM